MNEDQTWLKAGYVKVYGNQEIMARGEQIVSGSIVRYSLGLVLIIVQNLSMAASGTIPPDSLIPDGLQPGDNFYIAFVSSITVDGAQSAATYEGIAAAAAANNPDTSVLSWTTLYGHDDGSLVTTSAFSADPAAPIYNMRGQLVADNRAQFFSAFHRSRILYDENGVEVGTFVWTGFNSNGSRSLIGDDTLGGLDNASDGCTVGWNSMSDDWMLNVGLSGGNGCTGANLPVYVVSELLQVLPPISVDTPSSSQSSLTLRVGESAEIGIDGTFQSYLSSIEGPESVVSVSEQGNSLTVTALAEGSTTARVYQQIGDSAYLSIEVLPAVGDAIQDQLERSTEGQNGNGQAVFLGGVKDSSDDRYYQNGVFYVGEEIRIDFAITPAPEHVGEKARIVLALRVAGQIFLADGSGNWLAFDGVNLPAFREVTLQEDNLIELLGDSSTLQLQAADIGSYELIIGYELTATGELVYEPQSLQFEVVEQ